MIGSKVFEMTAEDILKGMSSSDSITDGGFSPLSEGINVTKIPGAFYFSAEKVDQTDELTDDLIASCEDGTLGTTLDRVFVDDVGNYYTFNGTLLDLIATDATNPTKYSKGLAQMVSYGLDGSEAIIFTTNSKCLTQLKMNGDALNATFHEWIFNGSTAVLTAPHPAIVFENNAYYGDGNLLKRQTSGSSVPVTITTLPTEQIITAFGIDPGTGRLLVSVVNGVNASDTKSRTCRVGYHDGFSNKFSKVIIVDDMITAFYPVGSVMYIGYGTNLGIWNGAGIQFLRALNVSLTSTKLPYRDNFTNIDDTLYVVEGNKILAYGPVIGKAGHIFYYAFVNKDANLVANDLTLICNLGSGLLGFGWVDQSAVEKFSTLDVNSVATLTNNNVKFYSNEYSFEENITFNALVIEYAAALPTSSDYADINIIAIENNSTLGYGILASKQIAIGATNIVSNVYETSYNFPTITTRSLQCLFNASQQVAIKRISFFINQYD